MNSVDRLRTPRNTLSLADSRITHSTRNDAAPAWFGAPQVTATTTSTVPKSASSW